MQAVTYQGPGKLKVQDKEDPQLQGPGDAVVRVDVAGICGSDLHILHGETAGVMEGETIGHEFVGTVTAAGAAVTRVEVGDAVVGSFQAPCMACRACRRGAYNGCQDLYIFGHGLAFGSLPGSQAEAVRVPRADATLRKVPPGLSRDDAILAGDVLTAAYTGVRPHLQAGDTVAVVGAGPVGLLAMEVAATLGAGQVFGLDLDPARVKVAASRGHVGLDPDQVDPINEVMDATEDQGADLVIEAVGGQGQALETAFDLAGPGGRIVALGVPTAYTFEFPWLETFSKGTTFQATLANVPRWIDEVLALQAAGRLETGWLISDTLPLDQAPEAYRRFEEREALKVLLEP